MNDCVVFSMMWYQYQQGIGNISIVNTDIVKACSQDYGTWCTDFYEGTAFEYESPRYIDLVVSIAKFLEKEGD